MAEIISSSARLARCRLAGLPVFDDPNITAIHTTGNGLNGITGSTD
jgi:hypothetical protein